MTVHFLNCIHAHREGDKTACDAQGTKQVTVRPDEVTCDDCRQWCATYEVVDFGDGPLDTTLGYPFSGTESQCTDWMNQRNHQRADGRTRFALQEIPVA